MFVAFYTGFLDNTSYGTNTYFTLHHQLSENLIKEPIKKDISIIGLDFAGMRKGKDHLHWDPYCAQRKVFIIENLCNLQPGLASQPHALF